MCDGEKYRIGYFWISMLEHSYRFCRAKRLSVNLKCHWSWIELKMSLQKPDQNAVITHKKPFDLNGSLSKPTKVTSHITFSTIKTLISFNFLNEPSNNNKNIFSLFKIQKAANKQKRIKNRKNQEKQVGVLMFDSFAAALEFLI